MMDPETEDLKSFLEELNLSSLLPVFIENCIGDITSLKHLIEFETDSFKLLCPIIGHRLKIKSKLNFYKADRFNTTEFTDGTDAEDTDAITYSGCTSEINLTEDITLLNQTDTFNNHTSSTSEDTNTLNTFISDETPTYIIVPNYGSTLSSQNEVTTQSFDHMPSTSLENAKNLRQFDIKKAVMPKEYPGLKTLLEQNITGRAILALYELEGELDTLCQGYLCEILVGFFLNLEPFRRLNNENFGYLSNEIVSLFPTEKKEIYYIAPVRKRNSRDNTSGFAKGKLVDKYKNKLTFLRRAHLLPSRQSSSRTEDFEDLNKPDADCAEELSFLKNNTEPWEQIERCWIACLGYRKKLVSSHRTDLNEILVQFPILLRSIGHQLVTLDFKQRFTENFELVYINFELAFTNLVTIKSKLLSPADLILQQALDNPGISNDSKHYLMITLMCSMIPSVKSHLRGKKSAKYSSGQIKESLIKHVMLPGDVAAAVQEHAANSTQPSLPFIIVEGPSYLNFRNIYVSFHTALYTPATILKALDICFSIFQVLVLKYPEECEHLWLFIQRAVYMLKTEFDNIPAIIDLANRVVLRMNRNSD